MHCSYNCNWGTLNVVSSPHKLTTKATNNVKETVNISIPQNLPHLFGRHADSYSDSVAVASDWYWYNPFRFRDGRGRLRNKYFNRRTERSTTRARVAMNGQTQRGKILRQNKMCLISVLWNIREQFGGQDDGRSWDKPLSEFHAPSYIVSIDHYLHHFTTHNERRNNVLEVCWSHVSRLFELHHWRWTIDQAQKVS